MHFGIGVDENTLGGEALGAVAGDGVAVVEMPMLAEVEFDLAVVVESGGETTIGVDLLDDGEVAIGNAERFVGRGELDAIAYGELVFDSSVNTDAGESARIIGDNFAVRFLNGELVGSWVDGDDRGITSSPNSDGFAASPEHPWAFSRNSCDTRTSPPRWTSMEMPRPWQNAKPIGQSCNGC